jgi:general secretion pathway protein J
MTSRGFTLVEMLVALLAFSLLSAAAVALLNLTLRNKEAFDQSTASIQELQATRALMRADFSQIAVRPVRDAFGGRPQSSFAKGSDGKVLLSFVRRGWDNPNGAEARSSLQYVEYVLVEKVLVRRTRAYLDPNPDTPVMTRAMLSGVEDVAVSFLADGKWSEQWRPVGETRDLPNAVGVTLDLADFGEIRQTFLTREH